MKSAGNINGIFQALRTLYSARSTYRAELERQRNRLLARVAELEQELRVERKARTKDAKKHLDQVLTIQGVGPVYAARKYDPACDLIPEWDADGLIANARNEREARRREWFEQNGANYDLSTYDQLLTLIRQDMMPDPADNPQ